MKNQYSVLFSIMHYSKAIFFAGALIISIQCSIQLSEASWLIDARRFYDSAHGELNCTDCHDDISAKALHPNPNQVNASLKDLIKTKSCLSCHEDTSEALENGVHGEKKVDDPEKYKDCIGCHNPHYLDKVDAAHDIAAIEWSSLPEDDQPCMSCHQAVAAKDPQRVQKITKFCFHCHASEIREKDRMKAWRIPQLDPSEYPTWSHVRIDCMVCHPKSAEYGHGDQIRENCHNCHTPHDEKIAHDAHSGVACEACHLGGVAAVRTSGTKIVGWEKIAKPGSGPMSTVHNMAITDDTACARCHFESNQIGASSMLLPPKSIICMPCHAATFSFKDTTTVFALLIFLVGIAMASSVWLSGSMDGDKSAGSLKKAFSLQLAGVKTGFLTQFISIIKTLFYDIFLQRRLYRRSGTRWVIHSLIFIPFVIRFIWGIVGLFASLWLKDWPLTWVMVDKYHPVTAFLFDLTGLMIAVGLVMAFIRGNVGKGDRAPGLPKQDRLALGLIGSIVIMGFILEALRIAMTGTHMDSGYSVIGYLISKLFSGWTGLSEMYGYVWYIHAILTGAFVAYLPFSRLMHIILAPVILLMNAVTKHANQDK